MSRHAKDWLKLFGLASVPLLGFWLYGLFDLDEGFYAAVVAEMNRRGEWITPFFNGKPWFEKPVLLYWLTKPSLALFGGEFGLRLPSAVATLGLFGVVAWFASRRLSLRAGQWSVLILGSSVLIVALGRMIMTDALLCLCLTGALLCFFESLVGDRRWRLASAFLLGLSVLAKGPVGCILFVVIAGITFWRERELRQAFRGWWLAGTAIFTATVASWYVPAYAQNGQVFVQEFLVKQNLQRFTGGDAAHTLHGPASWFFYVPILLVGMCPWVIWVWPAVRGAGPDRSDKFDKSDVSGRSDVSDKAAVRRFLATWAAVVFVFFSISGAKLPHYILPAIPPLAMLVAELFARRESVRSARLIPWGALTAVLVVATLANAGMAAWYLGVFKGTAPQSEAHMLARRLREIQARDPAARAAVYKMGRQQKDMGTGHLKVQETQLPSLLFYLNGTALDTDDFSTILKAARPLYVVTRQGRIGNLEIRAAGADGSGRLLLRVEEETKYFVLWRLSADGSSGGGGEGTSGIGR